MQDNPAGDQLLAWIGNSASVGAVISSLVGWLPPTAAVIAFIWYLIQIYESKTIRRWMERRRVRRLARLRAAIILIETRDALETATDEALAEEERRLDEHHH